MSGYMTDVHNVPGKKSLDQKRRTTDQKTVEMCFGWIMILAAVYGIWSLVSIIASLW